MSGKIMGKVWDLDLPHNQLLVLLSLADHADHEGNNVFPSLGLTAWKTGYSEQQVRRVLLALEKAKILVAVDRKAGRRTVYKIDVSAGKAKPEYVYTPSKKSGVSKSKGYQNDTPDPLHFHTSTPDIAPEEVEGINRQLEPSKEPSVKTDDISIIIKAWLDGQSTQPATNQYGNKGVRSNAKALVGKFTPEQITAFVKELAAQPYWSGKLITIGYVANNIAAHYAARSTPSTNPIHQPIPAETFPGAVDMPAEAKAALQALVKTAHVNDEVTHAIPNITAA